MSKVTIKIDDKSVKIEDGKTILDAARKAGIDIPTLCYNELWDESPETCRMCIVEISNGNRSGQLVTSCSYPAKDGLQVSTKSGKVYSSRRSTLELFLSEHILNCQDCPKSGSCELVKLSREYDISYLPVCADCPRQQEACLLTRGEICLGPLSYAGCEGLCPKYGYECIGCRGIILNKDIIKFALRTYEKNDIPFEEVLKKIKTFSYEKYEKLKDIKKEVKQK